MGATALLLPPDGNATPGRVILGPEDNGSILITESNGTKGAKVPTRFSEQDPTISLDFDFCETKMKFCFCFVFLSYHFEGPGQSRPKS